MESLPDGGRLENHTSTAARARSKSGHHQNLWCPKHKTNNTLNAILHVAPIDTDGRCCVAKAAIKHREAGIGA